MLASVTASAISEVHDQILEHSAYLGRSGIMVRLRVQARELSGSPLGVDQVKASALEAAADDIAWGRAPLGEWRMFGPQHLKPDSLERAWIRDTLPSASTSHRRRGEQAAADYESRCLSQADSAFSGVQQLPHRLETAILLQDLLWDDPRINADGGLRLDMRETRDALQRRLMHLNEIVGRSSARRGLISGLKSLFG